ncbi:hypothetical protein LCGC14_1062390 [marine sediment metagenome]|uniref:Uncharacterized protein n=1 Tax=marine sediment metagenome TaxID=412755 RepID=A0A0F9MQD9_9ZZZZ
MVAFHNTRPRQKMPDECKLSSDHRVYLRIDFDRVQNKWGTEYFGNLMKYYEWVEFQGIKKMEHNLVRLGREDMNKSTNVLVMFTFPTVGDAVAFKLRWL